MKLIKNSVEMAKKLYDFVQSVRRDACKMDENALKNGKIIKYIFEIKREGKVDLSFLYSDIHLDNNEALNRANVKIKKGDDINIRGPFPLFDGALANSRISRWEMEREKGKKDLILMNKAREESKEAGSKYIYFVIANSYGVDRLVHYESTKRAVSKKEVSAMMNKIYYGTGYVIKTCLSNGKSKTYCF